ncbi:MAG TPA: ROK family protein [bacterium]|nr:ROK family protein [bacterium]
MRPVVKSTSIAREINRLAVIHALRTHGLVSQADLVRITTLSAPTVLRVVRGLAAEGLVTVETKGRSSGGRKPLLLRFNATTGYVIGVDIGGSHLAGAIADLSGQVVHTVNVPIAVDGSSLAEQRLYDVVRTLVDAGGIPSARVRAIGVGVPGVTRGGVVVHAPAVGWRDLPLAAELEARFGAPALVENDANMIALGEFWFGAAQGTRSAVCMVIGTGIGAGVILEGELYRGHREAAGEVGFTVFDRRYVGTTFREFGCLETFAAGPGIARRAREVVARGGGRRIVELAGVPEAISALHVFAAARDGDADAREVVAATADALAVAVANIGALLDPDVIVLGGGVMRSSDLLLDRIRAHVAAALPGGPAIVRAQLGDQGTVMGAVARALVFEPGPGLTRGTNDAGRAAAGDTAALPAGTAGGREGA